MVIGIEVLHAITYFAEYRVYPFFAADTTFSEASISACTIASLISGPRQRRYQVRFDRPLQRPRAIAEIEAILRQVVHQRIRPGVIAIYVKPGKVRSVVEQAGKLTDSFQSSIVVLKLLRGKPELLSCGPSPR